MDKTLMLEFSLTPSFNDTDLLGHINNTALPRWFETAREPIFEWFNPGLDPKKWNLILVHIDVDFIKQMEFGKTVTVKTSIKSIGKSSFTILHRAFQNESLCCEGTAVLVHFDYELQKSAPIPENIVQQLNNHLDISIK